VLEQEQECTYSFLVQ